MSDTPKKWRYPAQPEIYRENPAQQDYEEMLGHSALNVEDAEEFLRLTAEAVKTPEERARTAAEPPPSMQEMMQGPPVPYLSTPGLRADAAGLGARVSGLAEDANVAPPLSTKPETQDPKPETF